MYNKVLEEIKKYDKIIIHRHMRPDGDALGSQLGLKEIIKYNFNEKEVYATGDMVDRYSFIGTVDEVTDEMYDNALVIVLDCSEKSLISDDRFSKGKMLIKIDHHIKREEFANIELIDESFESCCGLIADIAITLGLKLNSDSARLLYIGMVTDSGRFRYDATTSKTFFLASKLLEHNIDINEIYNNLYIEELEIAKLRAKYVLKMQLTENNVAYVKTTYKELLDEKVDFFTASRGMVNTMSGIKGIDVWANFTEDKEGNVVCELRSSKYNVNKIATKYGGGGHIKASGCTVNSFDVCDQILEDLNNLCKEVEND